MTRFASSGTHLFAQQSSLVSLFKGHAERLESPARVYYEEQCLSFAELDLASDNIAAYLLAHDLPEGALVSVLLPRSPEVIISQLGILKAGGAYLPMSPEDFPIERIASIYEDAVVCFVITESRYQPICQALRKKLGRSFHYLLIDQPQAHSVRETSNTNRRKRDSQKNDSEQQTLAENDRLAYVMYTSGSTGKPKGVMITEQNIIHSVADTDYFTLEQGDAFLHAAPISFDAATFEIWAALLNGKDLYIVPEKIVHQLDAFSDFVNSRPVTIAWLTSALFNLLADTRPAFFASFKQILVGGEALSARHINLIRQGYPGLILRNNYGPTENTIFSTSLVIDRYYSSNIPIGRPVRHKRAYILNEHFEPLSCGQEGELFVAGSGVSPGYLNLADETRARFLPDPFNPGQRMYATGDICRYNDHGDIEFIGRKDKQVKISGHRIELGEIESVLQACSGVRSAVVLYKAVNSAVKGLVAYLTGEQIDILKLKPQLADKLPSYMIPLHFEVIHSLPLTVNAKVDRQLMQNWPLKSAILSNLPLAGIDETLKQACLRVLGIESLEGKENFFELGGDSLSGTSLVIELEQQLGTSIPLQMLYEHPCIADLSQALAQAMTGQASGQTGTHLSLANEAQLPESIRRGNRKIHQCPDLRAADANILLTGATGFFGAFLLKELLETSAGRIHCLVRARDARHAKQRLLETFREYRIPVSTRQIERIVGIAGDLSQTELGLSTEQHRFLANNMDVIFHNGAAVNYVDTYATLKGPNVIGSQEILKLASHSRMIPLHYISSVSVFETLGFFTGRRFIYETDTVDISEHFVRLGYSQSKWVAEKLMQNAREAGLPVNIYRSGYIMGHSETGVSNTTDHIARYIAGCIEMGCAPILQEYASLAPVDQLSRALCHIALKGEVQAKTLHLCNPDFISVDELYRKIHSAGFPLELMSYSRWKEKLKQVPSSNPLYPLLSLHVHPAPDHQLTLPELYEHNTRFDCADFLAELKDSGIRINLHDPDLFERWLQDYLRQGLISKATFHQARSLDCIA